MAVCFYDPYCLGGCEWTNFPGALQLDMSSPTYLHVSDPATDSDSEQPLLSLHIQPEFAQFKFATNVLNSPLSLQD